MSAYQDFQHRVQTLNQVFILRETLRGDLDMPFFTRDSRNYQENQREILEDLKEMDQRVEQLSRELVKFCGEHIKDKHLLLELKLKGVGAFEHLEYHRDILNIPFRWVSMRVWFDPTRDESLELPKPNLTTIGAWCGFT